MRLPEKTASAEDNQELGMGRESTFQERLEPYELGNPVSGCCVLTKVSVSLLFTLWHIFKDLNLLVYKLI